MKKVLLFLMLGMLPALTFAQETSDEAEWEIKTKELKQTGDHEIRVNLLMSLIGLPEINYEYFVEDNMGIGLATAFALDNPEDMSIRFQIMPYYRLYFADKKASGFFIEGNMAVVKQKEEYYESYYGYDGIYYHSQIRDTSTNFGLGAVVGGKFLARNGFVGEVYLGGGRLFGDSISGGYPRVGITIGKRF